jgi:hypothetical protein
MGEIDPSPYRACSLALAEAQARYGTCVGAPGECPAGETASHELGAPEATWACTVDLTVEDQLTLDFQISSGGDGIVATDLVVPRAPATFPPAECGSFQIIAGGVTYSPTDCVRGLPTPGTCVVGIRYSDWVTGTFNCSEIPSEGGADVLSTMNAASLGAGSFDLRGCEIVGG